MNSGMNKNAGQTSYAISQAQAPQAQAPCPSHRVRMATDDATFTAREDCSLLAAMEASRQSMIEVGCRGGGCGRCRVRILDGEFLAKRMSKAHIKPGDQERGLVLACRVFARSDIQLIPEPSELIPINGSSNTGSLIG